MVRKSDTVRRTAERMNAITITVALAALALGLLVSTFLTRRMLQPLAALSDASRKIGEGNFDTRAHVHGNDELARLGRDFNAMAGRLAEYRKSSLGDLLQAHLSMQAAIDSMPDPVAIFSVEGSLQNVNRAAETLLGLRTDSASKEPSQGRPRVDRRGDRTASQPCPQWQRCLLSQGIRGCRAAPHAFG